MCLAGKKQMDMLDPTIQPRRPREFSAPRNLQSILALSGIWIYPGNVTTFAQLLPPSGLFYPAKVQMQGTELEGQ